MVGCLFVPEEKKTGRTNEGKSQSLAASAGDRSGVRSCIDGTVLGNVGRGVDGDTGMAALAANRSLVRRKVAGTAHLFPAGAVGALAARFLVLVQSNGGRR